MQEKNTFFVIPARRDSKGFPFKNRILLEYTTKQIPTELQEKTIVTTNDDEIIKKLSESKISIIKRDERLCLDDADIRDVMVDVINKFHMKTNDIIVMLYLTSPDRVFSDIKKILDYFLTNNLKTLTCCIEPKTHPYLCLYQKDDGRGEQIIKHDLYRRQDYPPCIELRHFVCIFEVSEVKKLNKNMYNDDTFFYKIDNDLDIDNEDELKKYLENNLR